MEECFRNARDHGARLTSISPWIGRRTHLDRCHGLAVDDFPDDIGSTRAGDVHTKRRYRGSCSSLAFLRKASNGEIYPRALLIVGAKDVCCRIPGPGLSI